jgi:hypothetical protein
MTGPREGDKMGYERRQAVQPTGEGGGRGGRGKYWRKATDDEWTFPKGTHLENVPKHPAFNAQRPPFNYLCRAKGRKSEAVGLRRAS